MCTESERAKVLDVLDMEESDDRDEELFNRFGGVLLTVDEAWLVAGYVDW